MAETVFIKSKDPASGRVALWERDPAHPGGEVYCAGTDVCEVAETAGVQEALLDGRIVKTTQAEFRDWKQAEEDRLARPPAMPTAPMPGMAPAAEVAELRAQVAALQDQMSETRAKK